MVCSLIFLAPFKHVLFRDKKCKNPVPVWLLLGQDRILRCHPAWYASAYPLCAYHHTPDVDNGGSHSGSHTLRGSRLRFRSPSEVHSALRFSLPSQHRQLSVEKGTELTHSSSSVYTKIAWRKMAVKHKFMRRDGSIGAERSERTASCYIIYKCIVAERCTKTQDIVAGDPTNFWWKLPRLFCKKVVDFCFFGCYINQALRKTESFFLPGEQFLESFKKSCWHWKKILLY